MTPEILRDFAYAAANTDRSELEDAGVLDRGNHTGWDRFNGNLDIFIIKLSPSKLEAFAHLMARKAGYETAQAAE
jgi:hypothetical protein